MKASLIIFGVIFLVLGGLFYFIPLQQIYANTTSQGNGNVDNRTSSASVTIPVEWAYASAIIGFVLLVLGLVIPNPRLRIKDDSRKDSYDTVVETKENIKVGKGDKRKIVRERTEKRISRNDEDEESD